MAQTQIALLRGINVGRAKRIAMADLRARIAALGYRDVRTLLNSGNVVYTAPRAGTAAAAKRIQEALASSGLIARVTVVDAAQLDTIVAENPLVARSDNHARLFVSFVNEPGGIARLAGLTKRAWGDEAFAAGSLAAYFWCPNGVLESAVSAAIGRELGDGVTARNWSTVLKLQALANAPI